MNISKDELNATLAFLNRVSVNGQEADTLVYLKNKFRTEADKMPEKETKEKKK